MKKLNANQLDALRRASEDGNKVVAPKNAMDRQSSGVYPATLQSLVRLGLIAEASPGARTWRINAAGEQALIDGGIK